MAEQAYERITRELAAQKQQQQPAAPQAPPPKKEVSAAVAAGIAAGNINISKPDSDRHALPDDKPSQNDVLLAEFERRRKMRDIAVPTDDEAVKLRLRELGHPTCLFGEGPADRRDRLKQVYAEGGSALLKTLEAGQADKTEVKEEKEVAELWYHEGPPELKTAREWIANYSLPKARQRLAAAREYYTRPDQERTVERQAISNKLRKYTNYGSQVGDTRPLSFCEFSPDSSMLATASWSGLCKIWSVPDCKQLRNLRGHNERVCNISWHPGSCSTQARSALNLVSGSADGKVRYWSLESDTPIGQIPDLESRVGRVRFHPSGRFLGISCFDNSWRLWDIEAASELLFQEGHSREVYGISFHPDGSLVATSSLDATGRVWDLRTGKCILPLQGHVKDVHAIEFAPNGHHVVTGSEDSSIKLWDLRNRRCEYTLPAHTSLISGIKYQPSRGDFMVSASYDNSVKIWTAPGCIPLKTLTGHEGKVMSVDISHDDKYIATSSYDRTFKLWCLDPTVTA
eukprot:m.10331 g.10331  ORF g.10331 m.10331 type:complete len:514 (-) comp5183_c0_seq2:176-1717(-)